MTRAESIVRRDSAKNTQRQMTQLLETFAALHPGADVTLIERAYHVAAYWHRNQRRRSGDPFITHPVAVAKIVADLSMSESAVCAALLHDVIDDTPYSFTQLGDEFGGEVAALVAAISNPEKLRDAVAAAETSHRPIFGRVTLKSSC
jgi:guanosine-3',5'-bis(diphosphate) 3'-pyrophosphohydrolase